MDAASATELELALLEEAVRRVVGILHPERVYLYGSRARGDARADSDYDLMVVVAEETARPHRLEQAALRALADVDLPVSILVLDRRGFARQRAVVASLPAAVEREGRLLYAA
jgi:predicted nucleotidyltransferase